MAKRRRKARRIGSAEVTAERVERGKAAGKTTEEAVRKSKRKSTKRGFSRKGK